MAKKTSAPPASLLGLGAALLLSAAFLMKPFPLLVFAGLAPLYMLAMRLEPGKSFWEPLEVVGLALAISFYSFHFFESTYIVQGILQAIGLMICFGLFGWMRQQLGERTSTLAIMVFWLAYEYAILKLLPATNFIFLADTFAVRTEWVRWNIHTGYLGAGLWILVANWLIYQGVLVEGIRWPWLAAGLVVIAAPIGYGYLLEGPALTRAATIANYESHEKITFSTNGEWIGRTSAWISVLILLFAAVKSKTKRK